MPGPLATLRLAEWGAEVIKIEGPADQGQDDPTRHMGRTADDAAAGLPSMAFRMLNEDKQFRTLDLRDDAGRQALMAAVRDAEVLIEGFRPGVMDRLGLGWSALHELNPRLVMCAISGYGQKSVWSQRAGHDINYIAMAGVLDQIGTDSGELAVPNFQIGDLLGGSQAALSGVLAALVAAQRTGLGRFVDVSMAHEVMRHNVLAAATLGGTGRVAPPGRDLLSGGAPCYGAYVTSDRRYLAVGALEFKFWHLLCQTLDRPDWAEHHWTRGEAPGCAPAMALKAALADVFAGQTLAYWTERFESVDCCVTPVLRLDEANSHPLFAA